MTLCTPQVLVLFLRRGLHSRVDSRALGEGLVAPIYHSAVKQLSPAERQRTGQVWSYLQQGTAVFLVTDMIMAEQPFLPCLLVYSAATSR